jgi:hypothetical protein
LSASVSSTSTKQFLENEKNDIQQFTNRNIEFVPVLLQQKETKNMKNQNVDEFSSDNEQV